MRVIIPIIYSALVIMQLFAFIAGLQVWFGFNMIITCIIAAILVNIPFVGSIAGVCGAVYGWHWPWIGAIALFFGWFIIVIILSVIDAVFY